MFKLTALLTSLCFLILPATFDNVQPANETTEKDKIQVALLLDTSNSMDGLIDQAKSQLWKMVNELATSKKDGQTPDIEIALYEYGNTSISGKENYIRQITPLTTDLDLVSEKLFELKTNGGDEYCGTVIKVGTQNLEWTESNDDLKIMVIAGNEPFNQGPTDYKQSCKKAIEKGIMINTIHCGDYQKGINDFWKDGADLTDGKYMNIDTDQEVVHIPTPFDDQIIGLNQKLNSTYVSYGAEGKVAAQRQATQDTNAGSYSKANARTRASFKAKDSYSNAQWDLVDASSDDASVLEEVEEEQLPDEMKGMSTDERKKYIEEKRTERENIKKQIRDLDKKAQDFVTEKRKSQAETQTLDNVLIDAVKQQATKKNFDF